MKTEPHKKRIAYLGNNVLARSCKGNMKEMAVEKYRYPHRTENYEVEFSAFPFRLKSLEFIAERTQEKHQKVDQQPFILKVQKCVFCPALEFKNIHTETVNKTKDKDCSSSSLERNLGELYVDFRKEEIMYIEQK
jgi:hypothetical protein